MALQLSLTSRPLFQTLLQNLKGNKHEIFHAVKYDGTVKQLEDFGICSQKMYFPYFYQC